MTIEGLASFLSMEVQCHFARHGDRPGVLGDLEDSIDNTLLLVSPGGDTAADT